jgi:hypothetical protein
MDFPSSDYELPWYTGVHDVAATARKRIENHFPNISNEIPWQAGVDDVAETARKLKQAIQKANAIKKIQLDMNDFRTGSQRKRRSKRKRRTSKRRRSKKYRR